MTTEELDLTGEARQLVQSHSVKRQMIINCRENCPLQVWELNTCGNFMPFYTVYDGFTKHIFVQSFKTWKGQVMMQREKDPHHCLNEEQRG